VTNSSVLGLYKFEISARRHSQSEFQLGGLIWGKLSEKMRLSLGNQDLVVEMLYDEKTPGKKIKYFWSFLA